MGTNVRFASPGVTNPLSKFVLFTSQTGKNQEKCWHKAVRPPLRGWGYLRSYCCLGCVAPGNVDNRLTQRARRIG